MSRKLPSAFKYEYSLNFLHFFTHEPYTLRSNQVTVNTVYTFNPFSAGLFGIFNPLNGESGLISLFISLDEKPQFSIWNMSLH